MSAVGGKSGLGALAAATTGRLWTHICNFDHPRTLAVFQRTGFTPYKQEVKIIDDPRLKGLIPS
ncbi:MAG: hypothetical protein IH831_11670, partial [Planctomycetes bacterium]|nr:hypothetical protein [Planctomycetota bacterium]